MKTKEEYYEQIKQNRKVVADARVTQCTCTNTYCDWHGKCKECVALHRYYNEHIPACLQPIISEKLKGLVTVAEMVATKKEPTPMEYRLYAKERDKSDACS